MFDTSCKAQSFFFITTVLLTLVIFIFNFSDCSSLSLHLPNVVSMYATDDASAHGCILVEEEKEEEEEEEEEASVGRNTNFFLSSPLLLGGTYE